MSDQQPMNDGLTAQQRALTEQQAQAAEELSARRARAAQLQRELSALTETEADYQLLARVCDSLEALEQRGAAALFWGADAGSAPGRQVQDARLRIDEFRSRIEAFEAQHRTALGEVEDQLGVLDVIGYELHQARQEEESRNREWLLERQETVPPTRRIALPWMRGFEDDRRYRNTLAGSLAAALLLGLIIPLIDIPIPERDEAMEIPERFAKFIREERQPPLAVREATPEPEPDEPEKQIEPEEVQEKPPETEVAQTEPQRREESTREKVSSKGILAFRENFSALSSTRPAARLGAQASLSREGASEIGLPQRAMVAAQGSESSGGINLASISRDVGGGGAQLSEGVALAQVASAIDGGGPADRPRSAGAASGRTDEEIQIVFDRYKAALYRLYNRALRKDPTLKGQIVLRLTIEPDGSVSLCAVQRSDMGAPELDAEVVASVSTFQFGEKDVPPVTILYPIDFLPTA